MVREHPPARLHACPAPLAWSDAARDTVRVEDGRLLHTTGGRDVVLARGVTGVHLTDGPAVLVDSADGALVLPVDSWDPGAGAATLVLPVVERLERNGFRALVEDLGRDDAWTFDVETVPLPEGARVAVPAARDRAEDLTRTCQAYGALLVASLLGLGALAVAGTGSRALAVVLLGLPAVAGAGVVVRAGVLLREARHRQAVPLPADRAVPGLPAPVQLGTCGDELFVVSPYGYEVRLPGPCAGGVTCAVAYVQEGHGVREVRLLLSRRDGAVHPVPVLTLFARWWRDDADVGEAVLAWLTAAGVAVERHAVPRKAPTASSEQLWQDVRRAAVLWPVRGMQLLSVVVVFSAGAAAVLALALPPAAAWLPAAVAVGLVATRLRWQLQYRREHG